MPTKRIAETTHCSRKGNGVVIEMGGMSAMNSISRVIEKHGDELVQEIKGLLPTTIKALVKDVMLSNGTYHITPILIFEDGSIGLGEYSIDSLAERFDDCDIGY